MKNIFYFYNINSIGGVESMFYYLAKKYCNYDIVVYYTFGDANQIKRLSEYVQVKKYDGKRITCKKAFFNYNTSIIDKVDAEEYYLIVHADYKALNIKPLVHPKITHYIGVSQLACDSYSELTGKPCELCYNPIEIDKPKKVLNLISATRLTREKGKNRMIALMKMLDKAKIPYIWTIYTNDTNAIENPNVVYRKPRLDIINYINNADYLVQLSDNEGYCYSIVESLICGTPVICTHCPVFDEIGLVDGENCFFLDFDMKNVPIDKIAANNLSFTYIPKEDIWKDLLAPGKSTYQQDKKTMCEVEATDIYKKQNCYDVELNCIPHEHMKWFTNKVRAKSLEENGYVTLTGVEKVDK